MDAFREQRCRTCLAIFYVCRWCDRGQTYCGSACRQIGRRAVVRAAKQRYLRDALVREDERDRQRAYRARVRDQRSQIVAPEASVPAVAIDVPMTGSDRGGGDRDADNDGPDGARRATDGEVPCAECGRRTRFVRVGTLRATRRARCWLRARAP